MSLKIYYTTNAGLCFQTGADSLLVDVLHRGEHLGFSATPDTVCRQMLTHTGLFQGKISFSLTHLHPDHFDPKLMQRFLDEYPSAKVYGPQGISRGVYRSQLSCQAEYVDFGSFSLTSFQTPHDGAQYAGYPHCSLWLHIEGQQCLICGDAKLDATTAERLNKVCKISPDIAFVNVYQLSSVDGRAFLAAIKPKRIILYHLPLPEDDIYNHWQVAHHLVCRKWFEDLPPIELVSPLTQISS